MTGTYETDEEEFEGERCSADQLEAALRLLLIQSSGSTDDALHVLVGPPSCQLTVGHIVHGALAVRDAHKARRPE